MTTSTPNGSWGETPPPAASGPGSGNHALSATVAVVVGPLGPFIRTLMIAPAPSPVVVGTVGFIGLLALRLTPVGAWKWRAIVAMVAGAAVLPSGGRWVAVWMVVGLLLAAWAAMERPPLPNSSAVPAGARGPLVAIALGATWVGRDVAATWAPLMAAGLSTAAIMAYARYGNRLVAAASRLTRLIERAMGVALLSPVWALSVLAPWGLHRLLSVDPLRSPVGPNGTTPLQRADPQPRRLWEADHAADRLPWATRFRRRLVIPTGVVLVLAVWLLPRQADDAPSTAIVIPAAIAEDAWWPAHAEVVGWYLEEGFDPLRFKRQSDIASPTINVNHGERRTWTPPKCDCPSVEVWMYGGSTTFGLGQRDEHTIPSELAKLAYRDGVSLTVINKGVIGDTHWPEALRFAWDSASTSKPDLVVFFDGYNELLSSSTLNETGRVGGPDPADQTLDAQQRSSDPRKELQSWLTETPGGASLTEPQPGPTLDPEQLGRAAAKRYERSRFTSKAVADRTGIPTAWFWQPTRVTRDNPSDQPAGTQRSDPAERSARSTAAAARSQLAPSVADLGDALDDVEGPLFYDDVHINERGARLLANELYERLRPQLVSAAA